jgi:DNA-binding transcriptional LysR family regulator
MIKGEIGWDIYRTFLSVLNEGSLSGAARALGLTQPSIGRHIDALEQALGFQLFTRTRLGLEPNAQALELKPYAEAIAAQASALRRIASAQGQIVRGVVRISASDVIGAEVLPKILSLFMAQYPQIEIELSLSDDLADLLNREADIAVRMTEPTQNALVVQKAGDIKLGLFAHADYLNRAGVPQTLDDLKGHRIIGYDSEKDFIRAMKRRYPVLGAVGFNFRTDSNLAQLSAIRAGLGLGLCQVSLAHEPIPLTRLLPETFDVPLPAYVAMHENLKAVPAYRATFQALARGLKAYIVAGRMG